jgi:hypothetical protein
MYSNLLASGEFWTSTSDSAVRLGASAKLCRCPEAFGRGERVPG